MHRRAHAREPGERVVGRRHARAAAAGLRPPRLARAGGPRRERELHEQRHRQLGLVHDHRAGLDDRGPLPLHRGGRKPYSPRPASAGSSRPTTRIAELATMRRSTSRRRLLRADEDDAERAAPLGHVEEDLLDRARAVAGRVLVELVEHDELQRPGLTRALLALERPAQDDADDEALGPVVEVVEVDHRDLRASKSTRWPRRPAGLSARTRCSTWRTRAVQPADERVDRALADGPARPAVVVGVVAGRAWPSMRSTSCAERGGHLRRRSPTRAVAGGLGLLELGGHVVDDHRVLLAVVLGVGEEERQQLVVAELLRASRRTDVDAERAAGDVGRARGVALPRRREHADAARRRRPAGRPRRSAPGCRRSSCDVGVVEEQQVLALHVEDRAPWCCGLGAEHARVEERVEQEGGVGGLGGHAARCR